MEEATAVSCGFFSFSEYDCHGYNEEIWNLPLTMLLKAGIIICVVGV
jgi:hypothetical protein